MFPVYPLLKHLYLILMTGSGFLDVNSVKISVLSCIVSLTNKEYSIFVETQRMNNSKNYI